MSASPTLLQRCRQLCALVQWLLLPVLLWTAVHPALINAAQPAGERIMLCSAQGMIWVEVVEQADGALGLVEQLQPTDDDEPASAWSPCPWCRHVGHWPALPPQEPAFWQAPNRADAPHPVPLQHWANTACDDYRLPLARAPPL